jgi:hypothetical protein
MNHAIEVGFIGAIGVHKYLASSLRRISLLIHLVSENATIVRSSYPPDTPQSPGNIFSKSLVKSR